METLNFFFFRNHVFELAFDFYCDVSEHRSFVDSKAAFRVIFFAKNITKEKFQNNFIHCFKRSVRFSLDIVSDFQKNVFRCSRCKIVSCNAKLAKGKEKKNKKRKGVVLLEPLRNRLCSLKI